MQISLIHLSDIHIDNIDNIILERANSLASAITSVKRNADLILILVTGDIAYSGKSDEYELASRFFYELRECMGSSNPSSEIKWLFVPGNHDCNFKNELQPRPLIIEGFSKIPNEIKEESINQCIEVQSNYFSFLKNFYGVDYNEYYKQVYFEQIINSHDKIIKINCLNTSWCSRKDETPGSLYVPISLIKVSDTPCDVSISILHHPFSWLTQDNRRRLQRLINKSSDVVLTGHEHDSTQYSLENIDGDKSDYIEGNCLQDKNSNKSGFNAIIIDLLEAKYNVILYEWERGLYRVSKELGAREFKRNKDLYTRKFQNNDEYYRLLNDLGITLTHRRKKDELKIDDLFIFPDFYEWPLSAETPENAQKSISGDEFIKRIQESNHTIITGEELSGKTVLSKRIYQELQKLDFIPILMRGENLKGHSQERFLKSIENAFVHQYNRDLLEDYIQLNKSKKVLIIDDYDKLSQNLNKEGRSLALSRSIEVFEKVIVIGSDLIQLEEFTNFDNVNNLIMTFHHFEIKPAGHLKRRKLIEKWIYLGAEYALDQIKGDYQVDQIEKQIEDVLGNNLLPRYPFFIYTVMQILEANTNVATMPSSYSYLYESLLIQTLSRTSSDIPLDMKCKYLSIVAYYLFESKVKFVGDEKLHTLLKGYEQKYGVSISFEKIMQDFIDARIFKKAGEICFNHPYLYYYFVARYIHENMKDPKLRNILKKQLNEMIKSLYSEESANIILFYLYLTQDENVIKTILINSRKILSEYEPCDFKKDFEIYSKMDTMAFENPSYVRSDPQKNREKYLKELDKIEQKDERKESSDKYSIENESKPSELNLSAKSMQVIGQILRNFPGSLYAEQKIQLAKEVYLLGLRTHTYLLKSIEDNIPQLKKWILRALDKKIKFGEGAERERFLNSLVYVFALLLAHAMIKKISTSLGMVQLSETFKSVLSEDDSIANTFIDIYIKLEFFPGIPESEIKALHKRIKKDNFILLLLRYIVLEHFYLYRTDHTVRQRVLDNLKIVQKNPKLLPHPAKKRKEFN